MAPFILSIRTGNMKKNHFKDLVSDGTSEFPLIPQILGNDAIEFVETTKALADLGYTEVNWNLGCPYAMVANKKRGSGLLPDPARIGKFLDEACAKSPLPISVKLRLGRTDPEEIITLMPVLNGHPLTKVIIHPRIGIQMYKGEVDLDGFDAAASLCKHEVMYNGDIKNLDAFNILQARFPQISEWMIGRWAISNPFLPGMIRGLAMPADPIGEISAFHDELYDSYRSVLFGPAHVLDKMKEIWSYLGKLFPRGGQELAKLSRATTLESYEKAVACVLRTGELAFDRS